MEKQVRVSHIDNVEYVDKKNVLGQRIRFGVIAKDEEDTGMFVRYLTYFAGTMTPEHTHHCAHGIYVLSGTLRTNGGDFGPGSCAWYPEGVVAFHGATSDADVVCLFITNKPFDITYENPEYNR